MNVKLSLHLLYGLGTYEVLLKGNRIKEVFGWSTMPVDCFAEKENKRLVWANKTMNIDRENNSIIDCDSEASFGILMLGTNSSDTTS